MPIPPLERLRQKGLKVQIKLQRKTLLIEKRRKEGKGKERGFEGEGREEKRGEGKEGKGEEVRGGKNRKK